MPAEGGFSLKGLENIFKNLKSLSGSREPERLFYLTEPAKQRALRGRGRFIE